eukprot:COSAG06_NODE_6953_length_2701_cov_1.923905_3_plen_113_part_00
MDGLRPPCINDTDAKPNLSAFADGTCSWGPASKWNKAVAPLRSVVQVCIYIYVYPCDSFTLNFAKTGSGRTHNGKKGAVFFQPVATDLVTDSATDLATSCHVVPRDTSTALS